MRKKKTALQNPGDRKASPNQTKGLVAKGEKPRQSEQEGCVLDNHSHRTVCVSAAEQDARKRPETQWDYPRRQHRQQTRFRKGAGWLARVAATARNSRCIPEAETRP